VGTVDHVAPGKFRSAKKSLICRCLRDAVNGILLTNVLSVKRKAGLEEIGAPILSRYPVAEFLCGSRMSRYGHVVARAIRTSGDLVIPI
jgi:hypothetical protein